MPAVVDKAAAGDGTWIGRQEIEAIRGALKPSAYVARAYRHARENDGRLPDWARKKDDGQWLFESSFVEADARQNSETIGINKAAQILGASRRTVQNWVDEGLLAAAADPGGRGGRRRIQRDRFMKDLPDLRKRLETAAVIAWKASRGEAVPAEVMERLERESEAKEKAEEQHRAAQQRAKRAAEQQSHLAEVLRRKREAAEEMREAAKAAGTAGVAEKRAAEEFARLKKEADQRLREARRAVAAAEEARLEARRLARKARDEAGLAEGRARRLARALMARLGAIGRQRREASAARAEAELRSRRQAAAVERAAAEESRLKSRMDAVMREQAAVEAAPGPPATSEETARHREAVRQQAEAIEVQLRRAKEARHAVAQLERRAAELARRIAADLADGRLERVEAMMLFVRSATDEGVPEDVRKRVRKQFFGR